MTPLRDLDCLHISTNPRLGKMIPRIGNRQMSSEDRTIPRISCAESIVSCIYGHSDVLQTSVKFREFSGDAWVDIKVPMFHIYRLNIEEAVRPSKKLVGDAVRTRELWIVPYAPEACNVQPERIGQFIMKNNVDIRTGSSRTITNTFVLKLIVPAKLNDEVLPIGHYQFRIKGSLTALGDNPEVNEAYDIKSISGVEFATVVKSMSK